MELMELPRRKKKDFGKSSHLTMSMQHRFFTKLFQFCLIRSWLFIRALCNRFVSLIFNETFARVPLCFNVISFTPLMGGLGYLLDLQQVDYICNSLYGINRTSPTKKKDFGKSSHLTMSSATSFLHQNFSILSHQIMAVYTRSL